MLSVVMPCFNEASRLPQTLKELLPAIASMPGGAELILVDDGSGDQTPDLIRQASEHNLTVRGHFLPRNKGKGRAVAEGVALSRGAQVLICDADLSVPLSELPKLQACLDAGHPVVIASRALPEAEVIASPWYRQVMSKTFARLVRTLLLPGISDSQCGFKLFDGNLARELFSGLALDGFAFDVEILFRAHQRGLGIAQAPVRWENSPASRVRPLQHSLEMLRDVLKIRLGIV